MKLKSKKLLEVYLHLKNGINIVHVRERKCWYAGNFLFKSFLFNCNKGISFNFM